MKTRLAEILAQSCDAAGNVDREKLYSTLTLTPDDPVSIIIEAFLATEHTRQQLTRDLTQEHEAAEEFLGQKAEEISEVAGALAEDLKSQQGAFSKLHADAHRALQGVLAEIVGRTQKLTAAAEALAERPAKRSFAWGAFTTGTLMGACIALAAALFLK